MNYKVNSFLFLIIYILFFHFMESYSNSVFQVGTYILAFPLILCWIIETLKSKTINFYNISFIGILYSFYILLTCLWSSNIDYSINYFLRFFSVFIMYILILDLVNSSERLFKILYVYILGILPIAFNALFNVLNGETYAELSNRYSADGFDPNNFGILLNLTIIFCYILIINKKINLLLAILYIFLLSFLILSTGSRASLGTLFLGLLLTSSIFVLKKPKYFPILLLGVVAFFYKILDFIPTNSLERALSGVSLDEESRFLFWKYIYESIEGINFIFGHGIGTVVPVFGYNAHNTFVSNFYEGGLIGLIIWTIFVFIHYFWIFYSYIKTKNLILVLLILSLITILGGLMTLNWEFRKDLYILFAIVLVASRIIFLKKIND